MVLKEFLLRSMRIRSMVDKIVGWESRQGKGHSTNMAKSWAYYSAGLVAEAADILYLLPLRISM